MDPQQRLFPDGCLGALGRAGIPPHDLRERQVGVFVGANAHDYEHVCWPAPPASTRTRYRRPFSAISGRLSHFLGLRGPSLTVDTACSSSLTAAVHLACNSLLAGGAEDCYRRRGERHRILGNLPIHGRCRCAIGGRHLLRPSTIVPMATAAARLRRGDPQAGGTGAGGRRPGHRRSTGLGGQP
ncbi:beta-ketoacyl synthase N-terminal-like domain-containing protein [Pseudomonas aeruginosa]